MTDILAGMVADQLEKARNFARNAYAAQYDEIVKEHQQKIAEMQNRHAARGILLSGMTIHETARIHGDQIKTLAEARLDALLEGCELHGVEIDDQMALNMCDEAAQGMNQMIYSTKSPAFGGMPPMFPDTQYRRMVEQAVGINAAALKTRIDRRRLMPKKKEGPMTIYNVKGDNARWNINSTDNSVNVITKSHAEFFSALRERIQSAVPEGNERNVILEKLDALDQSHGQPSFAKRYTEFIAVAANHMAVLTPFIPALTEMLHKVLS